MRKIINLILFVMVGVFIFTSCVDDKFDEPKFPFTDPDITTNTTIKEIKDLYSSSLFTIEDDLIFDAVVIGNDSLGNFYKKIVVQDETGGIEILIDGRNLYGKYPVGRKIFVKAKNMIIGYDHGVVQLGGLKSGEVLIEVPFKDLENFVVGGSLHNNITPKVLNIGSFSKDDISTLVKFENVEFKSDELGKTYADDISRTDVNRSIADCSKKEFIIRSSGYSEFAGDTVASKNGDLICVLGIYKRDNQNYESKYFQGYIRSPQDVRFDGERCSGGVGPGDKSFNNDFSDDDINAHGWSTQVLVGSANWSVSEHSGEKFAKITNYNGSSNEESDAWLISPEVDLSDFEKPALSFKNTNNYSGPDMEIFVSDKYDGTSAPVLSDWTKLSAKLSTGKWEWVESGNISLQDFQSKKVYVAFRYTGTNSEGKTWEIDDVVMKEDDGGSGPVGLFSDDFEGGSLDKWTIVSVSGDQKWEYSDKYGNPNSCAKVTGYSNSNRYANEDWLITPSVDLAGNSSATLKFDNATKYDGPPMQVYISTDYSGTGDPNSSTWSEITYTKSDGNWNWTSSSIDLSSYADKKIYVGFKYTSTDSKTSTWEIDNVVIK